MTASVTFVLCVVSFFRIVKCNTQQNNIPNATHNIITSSATHNHNIKCKFFRTINFNLTQMFLSAIMEEI